MSASSFVYSQCTSAACSGTSISGASNYTIPSATTYYVASGNTWSGNVTFTDATSVLCIEGTWTGKMAVASSAPGTINVRDGGVVNNATTWSHNGGGTVNININTGATFTISSFAFSGGTYTITNCGTLTFTGNSSNNGGTITINNYGTIDIQGTFTNSSSTWTFDNKAGGVIKARGAGTAFSFSAGSFINSGNFCIPNNIAYNGGTLTNNSCISMNDYTTNTANGLTNNGIMTVNGNFSNSGSGQVNNGEINITGNFTNSGIIALGDQSLITCVNWTVNGTINGPASGTGCMRATGTTTFSGTFTSNSSRINMYDTGTPAPIGSPAFPFDSNTGNVGSATSSSSCTSTAFDDCGLTCSGILPVDLLTFSAVNQCKLNVVSWSTATEINNDFFTIERSADGSSFSEAGSVPGAGNSNTIRNYEFTDSHLDIPEKSLIYYRLKQTDYDGKYEYFGPIAVKSDCDDDIIFYPTLTNGLVHIHSGKNKHKTVIAVSDALGRDVLTVRPTEDWTDKIINLMNFDKGIYSIRVMDEHKCFVQKIVLW